MNAITRQRRNFHCMRIGGVLILVIAVSGTLGLQAQGITEANTVSGAAASAAGPVAAAGAAAAAIAALPETVIPKPATGTKADADPTSASPSVDAPSPVNAPRT